MRNKTLLNAVIFVAGLGIGCGKNSTTTSSVKEGASNEEVLQEFQKELADAKKDELGCLWTGAQWERREKEPAFDAHLRKVCETEKKIVELTNADRAKYTKNPLVLDQRLSYIARIRAAQFASNGREDAHAAWYDGRIRNWFKTFFPAASRVINTERENYGMVGGQAYDSMSPTQLANQFVTMWIGSGGHHSPMIDPANSYIGVGLHHQGIEWSSYQEFGEWIRR